MKTSAFDRYAPFIQEYIYRKKWADLKDVQKEACEAILDTDHHVIIASGTASGKTEAAFFPILTELDKKPSASIGIMYIGPLKALINDQFERLDALLAESDIPVYAWHGDVAQTVKQKAKKQARGVLQITPESLEALIMRHPDDAARMFSDLRYVVIDEIHALLGTDRGSQVLCLLTRLEKLTNAHPRRIGLSATLNDYSAACKFLSAGTTRETAAIGMSQKSRKAGLHVDHYLIPEDEEAAKQVKENFNNALYDICHTQKCLIFTNSRSGAEETIADLKQIAQSRGEPDIFLVHHGSIAADLRRDTETSLRENSGPAVAAATLTLEMGIDIGDLDSTIQVGAPFSCASFVQRLGRSGRRSNISRMLFMNQQREENAAPIDQIPWSLLQTIAIVQLYLTRHWVEPFSLKNKPFSLLIHQTLSTLFTKGELSPAELARNVLTLPPFVDTITQDEYKTILRHLLEQDVLLRLDNGNLILGAKGESLTNYFTFYAVFPDEKNWRVVSGKNEIGTLDSRPEDQTVFVLSGRRWKVLGTDEKRKILYVEPTDQQQVIKWQGSKGDIHSEIVATIRQILQEDEMYPYLSQSAQDALLRARKTARELGMLDHTLVPADGSLYFFPWCGTKTLRSLQMLFKTILQEPLKISRVSTKNYCLSLKTSLSPADFAATLKTLLPDEETLLSSIKNMEVPLPIDKFDELLSDEMRIKSFIHNQMDFPSALMLLQNIGEA